MTGRHETVTQRPWQRWRWTRWLADNGVSTRSVGLVVGVLLLQLGFIASYLAAFHEPKPHEIDVAVTSAQTAAQLNALPGYPVKAKVYANDAAARAAIEDRNAYGAYLNGAQSDTLLVAGANGSTLSLALADIFTQVNKQTGRPLVVTDIKPLPNGDPRGLSGFYLIVGWTVGGYLVASALSISVGSRPADSKRAGVRLAALAVYSIVSGIAGTAVSYWIVGGMPHHYVPLAAMGALLVFGVGATTMALQVVSSILGIGLAVLLFVILGNPSAGGAYPSPLLPGFWRAIGPWLPPGAGMSAFRGIVYFGNAKIGFPLLVLAGYAVVGIAGTLLFAARRPKVAAAIDEFGTD